MLCGKLNLHTKKNNMQIILNTFYHNILAILVPWNQITIIFSLKKQKSQMNSI